MHFSESRSVIAVPSSAASSSRLILWDDEAAMLSIITPSDLRAFEAVPQLPAKARSGFEAESAGVDGHANNEMYGAPGVGAAADALVVQVRKTSVRSMKGRHTTGQDTENVPLVPVPAQTTGFRHPGINPCASLNLLAARAN